MQFQERLTETSGECRSRFCDSALCTLKFAVNPTGNNTVSVPESEWIQEEGHRMRQQTGKLHPQPQEPQKPGVRFFQYGRSDKIHGYFPLHLVIKIDLTVLIQRNILLAEEHCV